MTADARTDATMLIDAEGRTLDASPAALDLLGVGLEELRAMPPGAFSPEPPDPDQSAAFQEAWRESGSPDIFGESTIVRPDGTQARIRFVIRPTAAGRYEVGLEGAATSVEAPPRMFTAGEILAAWRAAERRLVELPEGSAEQVAIETEIAAFRERYQRLFPAR